MSALAQTNTGDLDISTGNLVVVDDVPTCTANKLTNLFGLFKGEWFRDQRVGVPYFQYVYIKNPNLGIIGSLFRQVCMAAPGVARVLAMDLTYTAATRSLAVQMQVQCDDGAVLTGGVGTPFVIADQQLGAG